MACDFFPPKHKLSKERLRNPHKDQFSYFRDEYAEDQMSGETQELTTCPGAISRFFIPMSTKNLKYVVNTATFW